MNRNCIFTICATNYVGLAKALETSVKRYTQAVDFKVVVADEPSNEIQKKFPSNVLIAKNILPYSSNKWYEMAFKYNLTEFCTSIKPYSINYLFDLGYEKVIYMDPDILTFSSMNVVFSYLDNYSAVVTPHILTPEVEYTGSLRETNLLYSGVYNFGFLALKNTVKSRKYTNWWGKRLEDYCFCDTLSNLFTDQKWGDMLPCFLRTELLVSDNKGLNAAPWNFYERKFNVNGDRILVENRIDATEKSDQLVFVHYSGYNYKLLLSGDVIQNNITDIKQYSDLGPIFKAYSESLKAADIDTYMNERYSYNYFDGTEWFISEDFRRLYRGYIECGNSASENPFSPKSEIFKKAKKRGYLTTLKPATFLFDRKSDSVQTKAKMINKIFKVVFKVLGPKRYYTLARLLRRYSIWENHCFIIVNSSEIYRLK